MDGNLPPFKVNVSLQCISTAAVTLDIQLIIVSLGNDLSRSFSAVGLNNTFILA